MSELRRREFLARGALAAGALTVGAGSLRDALAAPARAGAGPYGALGPPDANGLMLPPGFRSRQIARGLQPVAGTAYVWPVFSDGQATFRTGDGGWILVTNSESVAASGAGTSAVRFGPGGDIRSAYRILGGTQVNCAGGPTPWGTWLSCEEFDDGLVWECDPAGVLAAERRPALGAFSHEAAAVDPVGGRLYLTEDEGDGCLYRFTPDDYPSLNAGRLEVAVVGSGGRVSWHRLPDPTGAETGKPTRQQVPGATRFRGGEGIWYSRGVCYFTTKGDKKAWAYDVRRETLEVIFDREQAKDSSLDAVDNVTVAASGDIFICEDGGNMEIGLISPQRTVSPFLRFTGSAHSQSEVCGACFDPSGTRLYMTSQGAFPAIPGQRGPGAVYEVSGPFRLPRGGIPPDFAFGPPAGELRAQGPLNPGPDRSRPGLGVRTDRRVRRSGFVRRGLRVRVRVDEAADVALALTTAGLARRRGRGGSTVRPRRVELSRSTVRVERPGGLVVVRVRTGRRGRARLRRRRKALKARLTVTARDAAGNRRIAVRTVRIGPGASRRRRR